MISFKIFQHLLESITDEKILLYRAGPLNDLLGRGIFLSTLETVAQSYAQLHNYTVKSYTLRPEMKIKNASDRWQLIKELDPKHDREKKYTQFRADQRRNGGKLVDGVTAEQRLTVDAEKRILKILKKQGYDAVSYSDKITTDQAGEYQIFDVRDLILLEEFRDSGDQ